ncbi:hypothetical protein IQ07DRAFT_584949 [Pyrenochaeta sp. DS3sAY3a]|nr:hypothetical protein IQ07DRAFT_584949 [Pyrenochaeta sp. DS3sAY3a]
MILQPYQNPLPTSEPFSQTRSKPNYPKRLNPVITVPVSGLYTNSKEFLTTLIVKAKSEACLSLGSNLQTWDIEAAKGFFENLLDEVYSDRLNDHAAVLTKEEYSDRDLLPTTVMCEAAEAIHKDCQILIALGCRDADSIMPCVAALALSLGKALHENKAEHTAEAPAVPSTQSLDFQVFGTRCLYLFWCAEWLSGYLVGSREENEEKGMIKYMESAIWNMAAVRRSTACIAGSLLRNWVAWRMFTEEATAQGWFDKT